MSFGGKQWYETKHASMRRTLLESVQLLDAPERAFDTAVRGVAAQPSRKAQPAVG